MPRSLLTVNGDVERTRAYYHCAHCHTGYFPWDEQLGLDGRLSPGLQPLVALAGTLTAFAMAAEDELRRLSDVRLSAATARRVTEAAGMRLREQHAAGVTVLPLDPARSWDLSLPQGEDQSFDGSVLHLGLDAFSVPIQGQGGDAAKSRMIYTGLLYDPHKAHTVYLSDFDVEAVVAALRRYAVGFGLGRAETVVAITDGGNGLEGAIRRGFSDAVVFVLDWYHAAQHLHTFAQAWHGPDAAAVEAWWDAAKGILAEQGGEALVSHLRGLQLPETAGSDVREELRKLVGYFAENVHRTSYPAYRAKGWDIGSGPTEAGCKVLGLRVKGCGMRWGVVGAEEVLALRALYASGEGLWDSYWNLKPGRKIR